MRRAVCALALVLAVGGCGGQARRPAGTAANASGSRGSVTATAPARASTTGAATSTASTTGTAPTTGAATSTAGAATSTAGSTTTTPAPAPPRRRIHHRLDVGRLPQTALQPSAATHGFRYEMAALWDGIRRDSVSAALPAFFPEAAYLQLKAIGDPAGDWRYRLVGDYGLDIGAAHALLGPDAARARLLSVIVPSSYAHWVPPGVCYNTVGYWETPNSRLVYRAADGTVHSFGIASMISWRGIWFVVHLGSVLRPAGGGGVVDDPSAGEGYAAPSSTC